MPSPELTKSSRRPHLRDFLYSFAGAAFPNDSGVGGVRGWNWDLCAYRRVTRVTCACREKRMEDRDLLLPLKHRKYSPAVRKDIFWGDEGEEGGREVSMEAD